MTLQDMLQDIHAMREDLLMFERKYGMPTEVFYAAYNRGDEPAETTWVLDWSEWAATHEILQERLDQYRFTIESLMTPSSFSQLMERTSRPEPIAIA